MELNRDEWLMIYKMMKLSEEALTTVEYALLNKIEKELYHYFSIDEMENLLRMEGGSDAC